MIIKIDFNNQKRKYISVCRPINSMSIGNRYFLYKVKNGDRILRIAEICRKGEYAYLREDIAQFIHKPNTHFILVEPFLMTYSEKTMHAVFIPSRMASEEIHFEDSILHVRQPIVVDSGNFKDAKTRFYPIITTVDHATTDHDKTYELTLFKIAVDNEQVNITVAWKLDLQENEGRLFGKGGPRDFCTNNECCLFSWGIDIYYIRFDDMILKSANDVHPIMGRGVIYLVEDDIFTP